MHRQDDYQIGDTRRLFLTWDRDDDMLLRRESRIPALWSNWAVTPEGRSDTSSEVDMESLDSLEVPMTPCYYVLFSILIGVFVLGIFAASLFGTRS